MNVRDYENTSYHLVSISTAFVGDICYQHEAICVLVHLSLDQHGSDSALLPIGDISLSILVMSLD